MDVNVKLRYNEQCVLRELAARVDPDGQICTTAGGKIDGDVIMMVVNDCIDTYKAGTRDVVHKGLEVK